MERIINTHLVDYLLRNTLISNHHGFLVKHSTCTNPLDTVHDGTIGLDNHLKTETT